MTVTIGRNIDSLRAIRRLDGGAWELGSTLERLSSGQRINRASDDPAGLAVADHLRADARVTGQAARNVSDAVSYLSVADGATEQLAAVLARVSELAVQAASGVYGTAQRQALHAEALTLQAEYNRILQATTYNGRGVLGPGASELVVQMGYGIEGRLGLRLGADRMVGDGTFVPAAAFAVGAFPRAVEAADVNGDGELDLITTDSGPDTASVLLGNGNGTFAARTTFATGLDPNSLVMTDVNGDGKLDLVATLGGGANAMAVLLGNGDGTFAARHTFATGSNPTSVTLADLNGDGKLDLVATLGSANAAAVLLGNGDGTFAARTTFAAGTNPQNLVLADLNGDGKLDLTTADAVLTLSVLIGNGDGTFAARTTIPTGSQMNNVTVADLNGDGKLDLVAISSSTDAVFVLVGNGDGTFAARRTFATGALPTPLSVVDLNGDGKLDLVTGDGDDGTTSVLLGNGDGTFGTRRTFATGASPYALAVADLNGDGVSDLVTADFGAAGVSVLLGNGRPADAVLRSLAGTDLSSAPAARTTLDRTRMSVEDVATVRSAIGYNLSRLQVAAASLTSRKEVVTAAESRIRDADLAAETSGLTRLRILQQTGAAVLAQANQRPTIVLSLLGATS